MNKVAASKEDTPKVAPFTFGDQSTKKDSDKSKTSAVTPGGGFKFGAPTSTSSETSEAKQQPTTATGGFKFNVSSDSSSAANKPEVTTGGFNKPEVSSAPPPSGGFKFGVQETGEAVKPAATTTTAGREASASDRNRRVTVINQRQGAPRVWVRRLQRR